MRKYSKKNCLLVESVGERELVHTHFRAMPGFVARNLLVASGASREYAVQKLLPQTHILSSV